MPPAGRAFNRRWFNPWFFLGVLLLTIPIFAHGCHGDDVDHEPTVAPFNRDASSHP